MHDPLHVDVLPAALAICQLGASATIPDWATSGSFWSVTRTAAELSLICEQARVPDGVKSSGGWRVLRLAGPFEFSEVGVLLRIAGPLAAAGVSMMPVATWDTDYVLVREESLERAVRALRNAGLSVSDG